VDVFYLVNTVCPVIAIKIGRYSYEKRSRDVLELDSVRKVTLWHRATDAAAADGDDETTTSLRRLIDVILTSEEPQSRRAVGDVRRHGSPLNGLHDKHAAMQVTG